MFPVNVPPPQQQQQQRRPLLPPKPLALLQLPLLQELRIGPCFLKTPAAVAALASTAANLKVLPVTATCHTPTTTATRSTQIVWS